jgi:hypothetical protein
MRSTTSLAMAKAETTGHAHDGGGSGRARRDGEPYHQAESGSLVIFAGGPARPVERVSPVLGSVLCAGDLGAGAAAKLVTDAAVIEASEYPPRFPPTLAGKMRGSSLVRRLPLAWICGSPPRKGRGSPRRSRPAWETGTTRPC